MNKNVKIAKELVKLAKSLVANEQTEEQKLIQEAFDKNDYETLYSYARDSFKIRSAFTFDQRKQLINMLIENNKSDWLRWLIFVHLNGNKEEQRIAFKYFLDKRDADGLSEYLGDDDVLTKNQKLNAIEIIIQCGASDYIFDAWDNQCFSSEQKKQIIKFMVQSYDNDDDELQELWRRCNYNQKQFWNDYVKDDQDDWDDQDD